MTPRGLRGLVCVGLLLSLITVCSGVNVTASNNATTTDAATEATNTTQVTTMLPVNTTTTGQNMTVSYNTTTTAAASEATTTPQVITMLPFNTTATGQTTTMAMTDAMNVTTGVTLPMNQNVTQAMTADPSVTDSVTSSMPAQNDTTTAELPTTSADNSTDEFQSIVDNIVLLRSLYIFNDEYHCEPPPYDGWYNNLAHPDWGGAELSLTRRLPVAYEDGVYAMAGWDRPNPISISSATMQGKTGNRSALRRTALMTFFGQQVVEEILDAQRAGCPREYENIEIPEGHEYLDEEDGIKIMPFVRSRYSFNTGYSPNVPREQLNEITPWFDGGLVYGTTKAWADALRSFEGGRLADNGANGQPQYPEVNTLGLPMANPPNPIGIGPNRLKDAKRFFKLGNPRGNENPFLLTFGILWFRWHNYWADKFKAETNWDDERIFNTARKWVIATYQNVVFYEWLPGYLNLQPEEIEAVKYTGYKGYIHPGITHEFQSAAMRFGHTLVPPGVMRRNEQCEYRLSTMRSSGFQEGQEEYVAAQGNHGVRTCNSFWNPQLSVIEHDIEEFLLGMASQVTEREDNIITEDLQRRVFGPLEFSRRDLMALNIQRGRDHGLPDYNTARVSLGLKRKETFAEINNRTEIEASGAETFITETELDNLEEVYNGDIDKVDIWAGGLLETTSNGPGELFRTIILDQFVRSRDADRFWFENTQSGQFTEEQIAFIKRVTLWDIIVACTAINGSKLQKDPFHYTPSDPCYAEHPFEGENRTISEDDMEPCTKLQTFDYFTGSEVSYALSFLAIGIWVVGCVAVLLILAHIRQHRIQEARKLQHRKTRSRDPSSLKSYAASEWCGKKEGTRQVQVKLGPGKKIRITNDRGNKVFRTVDLNSYNKVGILVSPDGQRRYMVVKFDREYDIVLKFPDPDSRIEFISDLEAFLGSDEIGVGRERQEIRERELLKVAVTKEHRTKLLEKFFLMAFSQAFKLDFDADELDHLDNKETKDILECELTKTEFADVLTMKPDSLFVEQMFELVDQDNSGSISFREFLDVIVVFAKGQPEDKLKLMFNMYDIDRSGHLSRDEFRQMLKSMMEMVSASVEETDLDKLIHNMFENAGLGDKQALSPDDFIAVMADHKEELNNAKLDIAGNIAQVPAQKDTGPPGRGAATVIRRGNLNSRARQTIIRAYKDKDQPGGKANGAPKSAGGGGGVKKRAQSKSIRIETVQREEAKTTSSKAYNTFVRYFENNRLQIFYVVLYTLVLAGVFIERAYYYSIEREFAGLRRIAGFGVSVTRGAASAMMFTYSSILVTMCRNTITKLRETFLHRYVPFDSALAMHKYIAIQALLFSILHTIGHSINFYHISTQTADDLTCYFRDYFHRSHELPKFHYWAWGTITGFTGILLALLCAVIYTFAFQYARRRVFNLFWFTHNMWIIYFILMFLHGSGRLVQPPFTHYFALGPIVLFTLDKLVSVSRKKAEIAVVRAELLPSDVTMLEFKRPQGFEYKSGQWVRIACKTLSSSEYHPFTLTSAPHEENLSLHIRAVGPWTMNLRSTYDPNVVREHPLPKLFLDGPYGEGHQDWYQYEVAVLVGGGIGVTPFASILKDIVNKSSIGARLTCKKVYFIWVTRTQKHYEWLTDIIREVEDNDTNDLVSVHIFVTQFFQKFDLRTTMLYICERHFQKISNRSLFTGLKSITHFGRPQFTSFLQSLEDEHPGVGKIGVFSCGPPGMTGGVEQACVDLNKFDGAAFIHHYENF